MKRAESTASPEVECVADAARAGALLHPTRAAEPTSATEIGEQIGLTRQKVNYHLQELARAGFLKRAGQRKRRNMTEQRWVATARSYVLTPEVVGPLGPLGDDARRRRIEDKLSAAYLIGLGARLLSELGQAMREAAGLGKRLSTLSIDAELRFESAEQRARFTAALQEAVGRVVAEHPSPAETPDGTPAPGRPYRLALGCYPIPPRAEERADEAERPKTGD